MTNEIKLKTVFNGSRRSFVTSRGVLAPNRSMALPLAEAVIVCNYRGVLDSSKMSGVSELEAQIESLKNQLAKTQQIINPTPDAPEKPEPTKVVEAPETEPASIPPLIAEATTAPVKKSKKAKKR